VQFLLSKTRKPAIADGSHVHVHWEAIVARDLERPWMKYVMKHWTGIRQTNRR